MGRRGVAVPQRGMSKRAKLLAAAGLGLGAAYLGRNTKPAMWLRNSAAGEWTGRQRDKLMDTTGAKWVRSKGAQIADSRLGQFGSRIMGPKHAPSMPEGWAGPAAPDRGLRGMGRAIKRKLAPITNIYERRG